MQLKASQKIKNRSKKFKLLERKKNPKTLDIINKCKDESQSKDVIY